MQEHSFSDRCSIYVESVAGDFFFPILPSPLPLKPLAEIADYPDSPFYVRMRRAYMELSRRELLKAAAATYIATATATPTAEAGPILRRRPGWVRGPMTGAAATIETLVQEGVGCVYGIPGAQENELWDAMKTKRLPYLLCTHENSAAAMADGY